MKSRKQTAQPQRKNRKSFRRKARRAIDTALEVEKLESRVCLAVTYASAVNYPVGNMADFVATADFNSDGRKDLVTSSYAGQSISIMLGNANGTFQNATTANLSHKPDFITAGDVNNDGKADLITVSFESNQVGIMLGTGAGTFTAMTTYAAGSGPRAVTLGDFNADGSIDLAVSKSFDNNLVILRGNGNGTFQAPLTASLSFTPNDLVAGDFNNDGKLDLAAADFFGDKVRVLLGNGNATFATAVAYNTGAGPTALASADVSGDGIADLVSANFMANTVSVLKGNANGTFQAATNSNSGSGTTFVALADLDNDGKRDIVTANSMANTVSVLLGTGSGNFAAAVNYTTQSTPRSLVLANFNGDSAIDIATANQGVASVSVLLGSGGAPSGPVADAGGPYSVNEEGSVNLNGGGSSGTGLVYEWDLDGDGTFGEAGETGATPAFSAAGIDGPATRTVSLRITDSGSKTATDTATINITNAAPALTISGGASVVEGSTYTLNLAATDPGADTISKWVITWGDGSAAQTVTGNPSSVTHVFADNGSYTITATATDEDGTYNSNSKAVSVTNVAAALTISGNSTSTEGATYTLNLAETDPGNDTISKWVINWGDGSAAQTVTGNPSTITHVFADNGSYTISATATDEDGTYNSNSLGVAVSNVAPTLTISGNGTAAEGSTYTLSLGKTDPGSDTISKWVINWGDGSAAQTVTGNPSSVTHVFADDNAYTITATATDEDGTFNANSKAVTLTNVAPTLTISGANGANVGSVYTLTLARTDPGADTLSSWVINWGDGSAPQTVAGSATSVTHTFSALGSYTISATGTDEDGTYNSNTKAVTVAVLPVADAGGPYSVGEGSSVALNGSASTGTGITHTWDLDGDGIFGETGAGATRGSEIGATPTFNAAGLDGPSSVTVTLKVTDSASQTSTSTATINVTNVAPTLTISGNGTAAEGSTYTLNLGKTDAGNDTVSKWVINWGDGSAAQTVTGSPSTITHVFADNGSYTITATATDEDGTYSSNSKLVSVTNVAPTLTISGGNSVNAGSVYTLTLGRTDPGADTISSWTINWGDGSAPEIVLGNPSSTTHTYAAGGSFTITASASDEDGTYNSNSKPVTVTAPPVAKAGGPYSVNEESTVTLNGSGSTGSGLTYAWDLDGDGKLGETGSAATRGDETGATPTYNAAGLDGPTSKTVTLRVTDSGGLTSTSTATINVLNVAPTLTISGNASGNEGSTYTLSLGKSDPGTDTISKWVINWGDGSAAQTVTGSPSSVTHVFADNGAYTITATATDEDGTYNSNSKAVTIGNVAPTLTISGTNSVAEGSTYTLNLSETDPGADTISKWVINWGDGSAAQTVTGNPSSVTHVFADNGAYTITASATDEDGTYNANSKAVTVSAVAPALTIGGGSTVAEGATYTLSLGAADPGSDTISKWVITWGDGSAAQTVTGNPSSVTHTFADNGSYTISATATDEDGTYSANSKSVTVTNAAPTLTISGNSSSAEGSTYTLNLAESDPGADTISKWVITWGDGSAAQTVTGNPSSVTHVFADNGSYTISATATDEDGTYSANSKSVSVSNVAPTVSISGGSSVNVGGVYTLLLSSSDPGDDTISSWSIDWGDGNTQSVTGNPSSVTHTYAGPSGSRTITASAHDEDGTYAANPKTVSVVASGPVADAGGSYDATEGGFIALDGSNSTGDDLDYAWDLDGDGVFGETGAAATRGNETGATPTFSAVGLDGPSSRTVTLRVTDSSNQTSTSTATINIDNAPPVVAISGNNSVAEGATYVLNLSDSDPGADTITSWVIDWGDGSAPLVVIGNPSSVTHVFADNGSYTISASATDEDGSYDATAKDLTVTNVPPALTISGSSSAAEGSSYTLNLSHGDGGADSISSWVIDWGDGSAPQTVTGSPSSVSHVFADNGSYSISATATDEDGTYNSNIKAVTVTNVAPSLTISGANSVAAGAVYLLNLSSSDPGADSIASWVIDWGDGSAPETVTGNPSSVTHSYAGASANYTISATATDEDGTYNANSKSISVVATGPVADAGGAYTVNEGGSIPLDGSGSSGADLSYAWDLDGDGIYGETGSAASRGNEVGANPTFNAAGLDGPSSHTVSLRITDANDATSTDTTTINIANVAATLAISGNGSVAEGSTYTLNLSESDPGPDQITSWVINWGDGTVPQTIIGNPLSITHVFADNGNYSITATAADEDGTYTSNIQSLNVTNVASKLTLSGATSSTEGSTYTLDLSHSDPGADTISSWVIDWGDGSAPQTVNGSLSQVTHKFADDGAYSITATASDEDGTYNSNAKAVTVVNVAPAVSLGGNSSVAEGSSFTLKLQSSDPGTDIISQWVINWGDGTPIQTVTGNPLNVTHVFADSGVRTISATATDEDGTWNMPNKGVTVTNIAPTLSVTGDSSVNEGATYTLNLAATDPGQDTISSWVIKWGDGVTETVSGDTTTVTHVYTDNKLRTINVNAFDEDGNYNAAAKVVSVRNVAPALSISGGNAANEGSTYTLNLSAVDPGDDMISKWVITWGDGTSSVVNGDPSSVTHVFADDGSRTITATATDEDGTYSTNAVSLDVANVAPTLSISGPNSAAPGAPYILALSRTDPGADTITGWSIDWGDGTVQFFAGNPSTVNHTYAGPAGSFTITAMAADEDGTYAAATKTIVVAGVDAARPTAAVGSAPNLANNATNYQFTVKYNDNSGVNLGSIGNGDIRVTGPNGYSQLATLISVVNGTGNEKIATYRINGPTGGFKPNHDGTYTLTLQANQVQDVTGNFADGAVLGTFNVVILPTDTAGNATTSARTTSNMTPGRIVVIEDGVGAADRNDYIKFTVTTPITITIKLTGLTDNADLMLLNSSGTRIGYSKNTGLAGETIIKALNAGTYYVRVLYNGSLATPYRLRMEATLVNVSSSGSNPALASATDLGTITAGAIKAIDGALAPAKTQTYYKIKVNSTLKLYAKLYNLTGNADLELLDANGNRLALSAQSGTTAEAFYYNLAAGTYFIRVLEPAPIAMGYRLRLSA